jgi:hypothetical protein
MSTTKMKKNPKPKYKDPAGNLSDFDNSPPCSNQRKQPPKGIGMPTLVPFICQNEPQSTRTALPQPPTLVFPPGDNYCPLNHTSPHVEPSASICTAAAAAIDKQDVATAVDEEDIWCTAAAATVVAEEQSREDESREDSSEEGVEDLSKAFHDLVGAKTSGLDNLDYSSHDNDNNYFQEIKDKLHFIEYSNAKKVCQS